MRKRLLDWRRDSVDSSLQLFFTSGFSCARLIYELEGVLYSVRRVFLCRCEIGDVCYAVCLTKWRFGADLRLLICLAHQMMALGPRWEKIVDSSVNIRSKTGYSVLGIRAAGFVGIHASVALKGCVDYYDPTHKRASTFVGKNGIFIVEGDINDTVLLTKLFENPKSYIHSNIAGFVNVLEVCKNANPQLAIVWASSSSVYGLNTKVPFSEKDRTDQPASLYAATKKAGEEIAHTYNHIYGSDMAYFFFTKDILKRKPIPVFESGNHGTVARDFTYIDDIVKGCLGALDTIEKSTGSGGKKKGDAQFRIFNLGNTLPVPVSDLGSILEKLLKVKAKRRVMKLPRNGDVKFTHANISLAQRECGYKPTTDLQTGLKKFVRWYEKYYGPGKKSDH
ncbi:putative UDP-glucuronate 4-epimerase [Helianthus debilis subsp. tardiflorus]